jgi:hypothetical protein
VKTEQAKCLIHGVKKKIINWHQEEIQKLDRKTKQNVNHPWAASLKSRH